MSNTQTEANNISDVVKWECNPNFTRERVLILSVPAATAGLVVGELLQASSSSKVIVASTGSACDSMLLEPVTLAELIAGGCYKLALVRGPAVIDSDMVHVNASYKTAALAALKLLGIIANTEPTETQEGTEVET